VVARGTAALLLAGAVTFGLFYLMQALIALGEQDLEEAPGGRVVDFVRLKKESRTRTKDRELPEKKPPEEAPPPPDIQMSASKPSAGNLQSVGISTDFGIDLEGGPHLGAAVTNREAVPIVRVAPQYPERAARRGLEGWVLIEFTISPTGGVSDPVVVDSEPGSIFNRSALRAVRKFKFRPRIVDGTAVPQPGQRISIRFELEDD